MPETTRNALPKPANIPSPAAAISPSTAISFAISLPSWACTPCKASVASSTDLPPAPPKPAPRIVTGKGLPDDRVKDILAAEKKGYLPSLGAIGAPSLIARQQAISEKALGTSARLRKNHENIMKDLEWLKNEAGQVDLDGAAQVLTSASKTGNNKLKTIVKDQELLPTQRTKKYHLKCLLLHDHHHHLCCI